MKKTQHLRAAFFSHRRVPNCPVYDLHGHMGPIFGLHIHRQSSVQVDAGLKRNGIRLLVFCHHAALACPDIGNAANIAAVRAFPERLRAYCGINPNYPDQVAKDLASFDRYADVYVGFKFHASWHAVPITDARYESAWSLADERRLPVLLHTWGNDPRCGYTVIRQVAERYHRVPILLGHSCHGAWQEVSRLVQDFSNVYLDLCAVMDERGVLERWVDELGSSRIVFGTDYPWFSHHYYIGAVLGSGIGDEHCRNIFYRNAEQILSQNTHKTLKK